MIPMLSENHLIGSANSSVDFVRPEESLGRMSCGKCQNLLMQYSESAGIEGCSRVSETWKRSAQPDA